MILDTIWPILASSASKLRILQSMLSSKKKSTFATEPFLLKVVPKISFPDRLDYWQSHEYPSNEILDLFRSLKICIFIKVTNIGSQPLIIHEVGFLDSDELRKPWRDFEDIQPLRSFPIRLAPDEYVTVHKRIGSDDLINHPTVAFAKTDCSRVFKGTSPTIDDLSDLMTTMAAS